MAIDLLHLSESGCNRDVTSHLGAMGTRKNVLQSMEELAKQRSKQLVVLHLSCNSITNSRYRRTCVSTQLLSRGSAGISFEQAG